MKRFVKKGNEKNRKKKRTQIEIIESDRKKWIERDKEEIRDYVIF